MEESKGQNSGQVKQYGKILKENLSITLPFIFAQLLHINIVKEEQLPDQIQHTKERQPDVLKLVTDAGGEKFVLHIEFQTKDDKNMVYRMADYYIMLRRRYHQQVRQYVIFLGASEPKMITSIRTKELRFKFTMLRLSTIDYELLLESNSPEINMLAGIVNEFQKY